MYKLHGKTRRYWKDFPRDAKIVPKRKSPLIYTRSHGQLVYFEPALHNMLSSKVTDDFHIEQKLLWYSLWTKVTVSNGRSVLLLNTSDKYGALSPFEFRSPVWALPSISTCCGNSSAIVSHSTFTNRATSGVKNEHIFTKMIRECGTSPSQTCAGPLHNYGDLIRAHDVCDICQALGHEKLLHCKSHICSGAKSFGSVKFSIEGRLLKSTMQFTMQKRHYSKDKSRSPTHLYDVLRVTPKASSKDIKNAYYSLSKLYHPDLKTDDASAEKFANISEAYEVLGNKHRKKLYDRGIFNPMDKRSGHRASETDETHGEEIFRGQGQHFKRKGPIPTGRSKIYNFDEFYKQHYGESIRRSHRAREYEKKSQRLSNEFATRRKIGMMAAIIIVGVTILRGIFKL